MCHVYFGIPPIDHQAAWSLKHVRDLSNIAVTNRIEIAASLHLQFSSRNLGAKKFAYKSATIQMKATEPYFRVVLFIMLYKVVLTFESADEILKCYPSNESY